jgi:hypothetical protein
LPLGVKKHGLPTLWLINTGYHEYRPGGSIP